MYICGANKIYMTQSKNILSLSKCSAVRHGLAVTLKGLFLMWEVLK